MLQLFASPMTAFGLRFEFSGEANDKFPLTVNLRVGKDMSVLVFLFFQTPLQYDVLHFIVHPRIPLLS